jgi:uncharacterized membrane protein
MIQHIGNIKNGVSEKVNGTVGVIKAKSVEKIDINNVKYELQRNIERVDYEFNRRIHIFLLSIFFAISTLFIVYSYFSFGIITMLYSIIVFTVALVGENLVSKTGTYTYNMEHRPVVGRVPLFIPFLWLALNLGSLFLAYIMLQTAGVSNGLIIAFTSAIIPLFIDLLLLEPKLSRERNVWTWRDTTRLYAPYGNYVVWFAFPFLANLGFLLAMM